MSFKFHVFLCNQPNFTCNINYAKDQILGYFYEINFKAYVVILHVFDGSFHVNTRHTLLVTWCELFLAPQSRRNIKGNTCENIDLRHCHSNYRQQGGLTYFRFAAMQVLLGRLYPVKLFCLNDLMAILLLFRDYWPWSRFYIITYWKQIIYYESLVDHSIIPDN